MVAKEKTNKNKQPISEAKKKTKVAEENFTETLGEYLKGVRSEWKRITWPTREMITSETIVVLFLTALVTLMIFLIDIILNGVIDVIKMIFVQGV